MNYATTLTTEQQAILNEAVELLKPFDKEDCSKALYYFKEGEDGDEICDSEVCDNQECIDQKLKELLIDFPNAIAMYSDNNGNNDRISSCAVCDRPLNEQLTWIKEELDHHTQYNIRKRDFKNSRTAFDVRCMLESMPSIDYAISPYCIHQNRLGNELPLKMALERQNDFVEKVVAYAMHVIKCLKPKTRKVKTSLNK